jgi:hypothetical protein
MSKTFTQRLGEGANALGNFAQTAGTVIGTVGAITGNPVLQTIGEIAGIGGTAVEGVSGAAGRLQEWRAGKEAAKSAKTSASPALPPAQLTPEEQRQVEIDNELNEMKRQQGLPSAPAQQPSQAPAQSSQGQPSQSAKSSGMSVEEFSEAFKGLTNEFLKKAEPNTESEKTPAPASESKISSPDNQGQERYYDLLDKHHALLDKYHELLSGNGGYYSSGREDSREGATMKMERVKPRSRSRSRSRYEDPNERLIMQQREHLDNIWNDNDGLEGATMRMIRL